MQSKLGAFKEALREKDYFTLSFYAAIGLIVSILISLPFCPWAQNRIMEKFHLKSENFVEWALWQFVPSMYNFSNEVWMSIEPVFTDFEKSERAFNDIYVHYWINHYPLRYSSFNLKLRKRFYEIGRPYYVYIQSSYRGNVLKSAYMLKQRGSGLYLKEVNQ